MFDDQSDANDDAVSEDEDRTPINPEATTKSDDDQATNFEERVSKFIVPQNQKQYKKRDFKRK